MFEPIRGGTRGGQAEFKWTDVSADKDREHYLGHSINAPTGRWQKNKDVHWYSRDQQSDDDARAEIARIKAAEAEAMSIALGFAPTKGAITADGATGANSIPVPGRSSAPDASVDPDSATKAAEKEERRKRKMERRAHKEEKRAKKERHAADRDRDHSRSRSRSPAPRRRSERPPSPRGRREDHHTRSRSPPRHKPTSYGESERERERDFDRRRWEDNARRSEPGHEARRGSSHRR